MASSGSHQRSADVGLLTMRVVLGIMFVRHGWPKITGGPEKWLKLGGAMERLGVEVWPTFWGFMGAFAEFGGGILLALGLAFRPSAAMLAFTMLVATMVTTDSFADMSKGAHSIEVGAVFLGLVLVGPGRLALDPVVRRRLRR